MLGHRPEVAALLGQIEQQAHDERRAQGLFRRVDALLDKERRGHADRDVERRHEPQVGPVAAVARQTLAQRESQRVVGHEHPLGADRLGPAQVGKLVDEGFICHRGRDH
jgi:hypothetical protein